MEYKIPQFHIFEDDIICPWCCDQIPPEQLESHVFDRECYDVAEMRKNMEKVLINYLFKNVVGIISSYFHPFQNNLNLEMNLRIKYKHHILMEYRYNHQLCLLTRRGYKVVKRNLYLRHFNNCVICDRDTSRLGINYMNGTYFPSHVYNPSCPDCVKKYRKLALLNDFGNYRLYKDNKEKSDGS